MQFKSSLALKDNAPAHRCLALLCQRDGDLDAAQAAYERAWSLCGNDRNLAVEIGEFLARHKRCTALDAFVKSLPTPIAEHERIALMKAQIALDRGEYAAVRRLLQREYCTIREGETILSDLVRLVRQGGRGPRRPRVDPCGEEKAHARVPAAAADRFQDEMRIMPLFLAFKLCGRCGLVRRVSGFFKLVLTRETAAV